VEIKLPVYNIVLNVHGKGGTISSDLKAGERLDYGDDEFTAAMDAIEGMILAHACAGINVASGAYIEGIVTAVDSVSNSV
jgi:hypothetical protein